MQEKEVLMGVLEYHFRENLSKLFPYIREGVFYDPSPLSPGSIKIGNENKNIKSCFVLINGTTLVKELRNSSLIQGGKIDYTDVADRKEFVDYLAKNKDQDGALIIEEFSRMALLGIIDPQLKKSVNMDYTFPQNYLSDVDGVEVPWTKMGGRTLVAAGVVQKFDYARSCIVKSTCINETGTGSISYFGPSGLEEEIIFRYAPELRNRTYTADGQEQNYTYLDDGTSIMGVYRKYTKIDGNFVLLDEQYIGKSGDSFVLQPSISRYSSIEDSLTSPLPQSGTEESFGYRSGIEGLVSGHGGRNSSGITRATEKVKEPCYSN